jgi:hypothetical protein
LYKRQGELALRKGGCLIHELAQTTVFRLRKTTQNGCGSLFNGLMLKARKNNNRFPQPMAHGYGEIERSIL